MKSSVVRLALLAFHCLTLGLVCPELGQCLPKGVATTEINLQGNFGSQGENNTLPNLPTTFGELRSSSLLEKTVTVYDSLGEGHTVYFFFFHLFGPVYQLRLYVDSADLEQPVVSPGIPMPPKDSNGDDAGVGFRFNADGSLAGIPFDYNVLFPWNNGSALQTITLLVPTITQVAGDPDLSLAQDGFPPSRDSLRPTYTPSAPLVRRSKRSLRISCERHFGVKYEVLAT